MSLGTSWDTTIVVGWATAYVFSPLGGGNPFRLTVTAVIGDLWIGDSAFTPVVTPVTPSSYGGSVCPAYLLQEGKTETFDIEDGDTVYIATGLAASTKGLMAYQARPQLN